ncbi:pectate lyase [Micromonospora sp. KC723]|nr:pectate lyase [Micromonospora sp. KC723]
MATADNDDLEMVNVGAAPATSPSAVPRSTTAAGFPNSATAPPSGTRSSGPTTSPTASTRITAGPRSNAGPSGGSAAGFPAWPKPTTNRRVTATITVPSSGLDGEMRRYHGVGDGSQGESQPPMFELADGATLKNVVIGAPAGDGVLCRGSCTIRNVWWEDVGEDAATFKGGASARYLVDGGGARGASDKVFQHNGGGALTIRNFQVEDFGKLYRSCGNCKTQHKRAVVIENVKVTAPGQALAGVNANYGDTATFREVTVVGDTSRKISICDRFTGNSSGAEPKRIASGADGASCRYSSSDITYR